MAVELPSLHKNGKSLERNVSLFLLFSHLYSEAIAACFSQSGFLISCGEMRGLASLIGFAETKVIELRSLSLSADFLFVTLSSPVIGRWKGSLCLNTGG